MRYNIVRIPKSDEALAETLGELAPFLEAMYTEEDAAVHGPFNFDLGHWLFLWDSGAGFILESRSDAGQLMGAAMCTRFRDLWSGKMRVDMQRYAFAIEDNTTALAELMNMKDYLVGVESMLGFDELYIIKRTVETNEIKELTWCRSAG